MVAKKDANLAVSPIFCQAPLKRLYNVTQRQDISLTKIMDIKYGWFFIATTLFAHLASTENMQWLEGGAAAWGNHRYCNKSD
ncbi:hypothetical protein TNCV_640811 [Trichonephila clavipes]|nr:hypothetical protein TNCV_640811 [Trichonephila clavipes]